MIQTAVAALVCSLAALWVQLRTVEAFILPLMSSAAKADKNAPFFGECIDAKHGGRYEVQWHHAWRRVTKNENGTTGFATILQSSSEARPIGAVCRIHLCAHNPCMARWPDSKYGIVGPPMHLQPVFSAVAQSSAPPAVAEPSAPPAVAESSAPCAVAESSAPQQLRSFRPPLPHIHCPSQRVT